MGGALTKIDTTPTVFDISKFEDQQQIKTDQINDVHIVKEIDTNNLFFAKISHNNVTNDEPCFNFSILRESNILSKIDHPSIIKFIGYSPIDFNQDNKPVIVVEHCSKGCLKKQKFDEITDTQKLIILYGIAAGMHYLQSNKIVFRNLNTENILLDDKFYPKICGFQLAEQYNSLPYFSSIEGSPIYIAPEVWEKGEYSEASDIYAFSIVAYQLLTGQVPFQNISINEICSKVKNNQRPNINLFKIPESYKKLIQNCWAQDPEKRPTFEQIVKQLKEDKSFMTAKINRYEYWQYLNFVKRSNIIFDANNQIEEITPNLTRQKVSNQLLNLFKSDLQKLKYFVIEEAKQELTQIDACYSNFRLFDTHLDINQLKENACQKFLKLSEKDKNDRQVATILESINESIDKEYTDKSNSLTKLQTATANSRILGQIIKILIKEAESGSDQPTSSIQTKVNKILDNYKGPLMFNKEIVRQLPDIQLNEMVASLSATKHFIDEQIKEESKKFSYSNVSILYSPIKKISSKAKSLSNILTGDCYFVLLYGNPLCTRKVLDSISNRKVKKHQYDESITIYGPYNIVPFGRTVTNSVEKLKQFNSKQSNIYFVEVSDEPHDPKMMEWCKFWSFVSHITVLCSFKEPNQALIEKFNKTLLTEFSSADVIVCSPSQNQPISSIKKPYLAVDIDALNENILRNYIFNAVVQKQMMFMTSETVSTYSYNFISKKQKDKLQTDKTSFFNESMINYSYQKKSETIAYFHKLLQQFNESIYLKSKTKEQFENFNFNELLSTFVDKSQEFFYTSMYPDVWTTRDVNDISVVVRNEVKNDFDAEVNKIKPLQPLFKLNSLVKSGLNEASLQEVQSLAKTVDQLEDVPVPNDLNPDVIHEFEEDVNNVIKSIFPKEANEEKRSLVKEDINMFFTQNPTASDSQYEEFFEAMAEKYHSDEDPFIGSYFDDLLKVRPKISKAAIKEAKKSLGVSIEEEEFISMEAEMPKRSEEENERSHHDDDNHDDDDDDHDDDDDDGGDGGENEEQPVDQEQEFIFNVDKRSFSDANIEVRPDTAKVNITINKTCHDLYEIAKGLFSLNDSPFYLTRITKNVDDEPIEVRVYDDTNPISMLNSRRFTVHYSSGFHSTAAPYSTQSIIELFSNVPKIEVAKDFFIQTTSRTANYHVTPPPEHDGWLNVEFEVTNDSPTYSTDKALVTLNLNENETSYFQEGNALLHQSYQNGTWVTEGTVFLSFPDCTKALFVLNHCSTHRTFTVDAETSKLIPSGYKNDTYSRTWEGMNPNESFPRGGRPYYVPVGYMSEGIKVSNFKENTCVAFHGTKASSVASIISNGFKTPRQLHGVLDGHISLGKTCFGIPDFANAIFVSPSIKYSSMYGFEPIVASGKDGDYVESGHIEKGKVKILILQVRVNPSGFTVNENTTLSGFKDSHYGDSELEWRVGNPNDIFPYRLLYSYMKYDDYMASLRKT